jgi:iron complex outermembrane receptor protein
MLNTISYTAEWIYPLFTDAELTIGSQGQFQENENDGNRLLVPDAEMNEISAYSYLKKNYTQFLFEGGVRYDNNTITTTEHGITGSEGYMKAIDRSFSNVNGAFGVSFFPDDNWIFKLNAATGYRAPNLAELSSNGVHEGTTRYEIGNSEMKSEQNFQADAGITYAANCVKFTLSGFNNHVNDFIYLMPTSDSIDENSVHRFTQSDADLRGGEFSTDIKAADWLDINASYSLLIGKKTDDEYLPLMPADKIILNADIELPAAGVFSGNNFHIGLRNYLKQTHTAGNETPTPGYTLLDAGISSTIYWGNVPINLAVNATNILDKVYVNHLSLLKPLGVFDIGRNISLSANVPFTMN